MFEEAKEYIVDTEVTCREQFAEQKSCDCQKVRDKFSHKDANAQSDQAQVHVTGSLECHPETDHVPLAGEIMFELTWRKQEVLSQVFLSGGSPKKCQSDGLDATAAASSTTTSFIISWWEVILVNTCFWCSWYYFELSHIEFLIIMNSLSFHVLVGSWWLITCLNMTQSYSTLTIVLITE